MPLKRIQQSALRSSVPDVQPPTPLPPSGVQLPLSPALGSAEPDPLDSDDYYPYADGIPFASSPEQGRVMVDVRHALENYFEGWPGVYIGMDMLVFDKRGDRTSCLAPDVFLTFDVDKPVGRSYKIWLVGKPPDIVWEFGSVSTAKGDAGEKKERYRVWGVPKYWLYDPLGGLHKPRLQGFQLEEGVYKPLPAVYPKRRLRSVTSPRLGLDLHFDGLRLRIWDPAKAAYLRTGGELEKILLEEQAGRQEEREKRLESETRAEAEAQARREVEDRATAAETRVAELEKLVAKLSRSDSVPRK